MLTGGSFNVGPPPCPGGYLWPIYSQRWVLTANRVVNGPTTNLHLQGFFLGLLSTWLGLPSLANINTGLMVKNGFQISNF